MTFWSEAGPPGRPPAGAITFDEFLAWREDGVWAEWVGGQARLLPPLPVRHQQMLALLTLLVRLAAERDERGEVFTAPCPLRLPEPIDVARAPDLFFVSREHRDRLRADHVAGAADLVVEIVSPESLGRDRGEKFVEYERAGVAEYWLIYPEREQAEFYELGPEGRYRLVLGTSSGEYSSRILPRLWLWIDWFWQVPPPRLTDVLGQIGFVES